MILFRYIIKAHLIPFLFSVFTLMSVFLLQFFMKFADKLVGKGLSLFVIIKLIAYNLAWMLVLVVPMSVLVATLMAFGSMAQNNEVSIMKASGISLYKMMIPPLLGSILVGFLLIQFNNYVYPNANHQARILRYDISRKKPTLSLVPGVFSQEVSRYSILVRDIDQESNELIGVTIYDNTDPRNIAVVTAEKGYLYFSKSQDKLIMDLWSGEIHTNDVTKSEAYRKLIFEKHKIIMDADQFSFRETEPGQLSRGERELGSAELLAIVDSLRGLRAEQIVEFEDKIYVHFVVPSLKGESRRNYSNTKKFIYLRVEDRIKNARSNMKSTLRRLEINNKNINKYLVETHKKYAIPVACIVFILIGAPLGTMTRNGGIGVAGGISLIFFLIYWAFLMGGEKFADRGLLSPFWGMWSANFVLGALGLYFTYKSAKERITIDFSFLMKLIPKNWRTGNNNNENS
ncbi:MAG: LptF/LptG family permease [Bacteroidetes bacterium]|nr:LptF/LptG family permease [Bacteroidota bacterium]